MRITRRGMLMGAGIVGGGMVLGAAGSAAWISAYDQRDAQRAAAGPTKLITQWLSIAPDGHVHVLGPHTEMGQGTQTSLLQIVLEELDADPAATSYSLAPADPAFTLKEAMEGVLAMFGGLPMDESAFLRNMAGRMATLANMSFTGGSVSVMLTGWRGMRPAAAAARQMLVTTAAKRLGVPEAELRTENSRVVHDGSGQSLGYGELAEEAGGLPLPPNPPTKDPKTYRYVGKPYPRFDIPEKVFGEPVYGMDVQVPGMRFAAVAPPPLAQGLVTGVANEDAVRKLRGVEAVVVMEDSVAVVADNPWRAERAVRKLDIQCDPPEGGPLDGETLATERMEAVRASGETVRARGEEIDALTGDDVVVAEYTTPFFVHVPMEPLNATVWEQDGKHHLATGTQGPLNTRRAAARYLGREFEDVVLHAKTMGGGFGRRNALLEPALNWVRQACEVQKAVGGAVKMIWSREAGVRMSMYHPADAAVMRAKLGPDGKPTHWLSDSWYPPLAAEESEPPYAIPNATVRSVGGTPRLPYGVWRSVQSFNTTHFMECFIDELAAKAGQDPLAYRVALLPESKAHVLTRVAEMANWQGPRVGDKAYGVAFAHIFNSLAAAIVEVEDRDQGPHVSKVWCAVDCGIAVNPGSVEAQVQGALYWGLSAARWDQIQLKDGAIVQSNFHDYRVTTFHDAPRISVDVMKDTGHPIGGVGELAAPLAAPALCNALAALRDRPRSLPLFV